MCSVHHVSPFCGERHASPGTRRSCPHPFHAGSRAPAHALRVARNLRRCVGPPHARVGQVGVHAAARMGGGSSFVMTRRNCIKNLIFDLPRLLGVLNCEMSSSDSSNVVAGRFGTTTAMDRQSNHFLTRCGCPRRTLPFRCSGTAYLPGSETLLY